MTGVTRIALNQRLHIFADTTSSLPEAAFFDDCEKRTNFALNRRCGRWMRCKEDTQLTHTVESALSIYQGSARLTRYIHR